MGSVAEFFRSIVKNTKVLVQKAGAFLMLIFLLGIITGIYIAFSNLSLLWVAAFGLVVVMLWNDFGEGVAMLVILILLFLFFPQIFPPIQL